MGGVHPSSSPPQSCIPCFPRANLRKWPSVYTLVCPTRVLSAMCHLSQAIAQHSITVCHCTFASLETWLIRTLGGPKEAGILTTSSVCPVMALWCCELCLSHNMSCQVMSMRVWFQPQFCFQYVHRAWSIQSGIQTGRPTDGLKNRRIH